MIVSTSFQIGVRGGTEWLHTRNDFVRQSRTDAAGPGVGSKDDLPSLQYPSGVRNSEFPASSRSTRVTGVLVCRFTAFRSTSLAANWDTNLYGQNEHAGTLVAARAPLKEVT